VETAATIGQPFDMGNSNLGYPKFKLLISNMNSNSGYQKLESPILAIASLLWISKVRFEFWFSEMVFWISRISISDIKNSAVIVDIGNSNYGCSEM
jgi:hypothetical protein